MKKLFLSFLVLLVSSNILSAVSAQSFSFGSIGGAVGYSNGLYNPALYGTPSPFPAFWGGGYNLNSLNGGGWGGYPAGYGVPHFAGGGVSPYYGGGCANNCGSGPCGALTGGFGGFYSPFIH
ncbi:MAG: hypothetical protein QNJ31_00435 [Candidatus Caenarcaniphilales bacterium]|nr:hypothetical protein [Candidatus Caenarcaniphilales bacterium]